jgi:hypothetical protein
VIERRRGYVAYLLRLWQAKGEDGTGWRASLERSGTGKRVGFASLEKLFSFLEEEAGQVATECAEGALRGASAVRETRPT